MKFILKKLAAPVASLCARSYLLTQFARLVVQIRDNDCNPEIERNGESLIQAAIVSASTSASIFIDVGANVGDWSASLVRAGATGRIVCVDPLRRNLSALRAKLDLLGKANYETVECALSDAQGEAEFFTAQDVLLSGHDSLFDMRGIGYREGVDRTRVRTNTLDALAAELGLERIHFLKVDVEGNELSVLRGARALLSKESIDFIQIEFGHAARAARVYLHDIVNYVGEFNYRIFVIKPGGLMPLEFTPFSENRYSFINFLIVRNGEFGRLNVRTLSQ